jgi:hypothetical protein
LACSGRLSILFFVAADSFGLVRLVDLAGELFLRLTLDFFAARLLRVRVEPDLEAISICLEIAPHDI